MGQVNLLGWIVQSTRETISTESSRDMASSHLNQRKSTMAIGQMENKKDRALFTPKKAKSKRKEHGRKGNLCFLNDSSLII